MFSTFLGWDILKLTERRKKMTVNREQDIEFKQIQIDNSNEIIDLLDYCNFGLPAEFFIENEIRW